MFILLFNSSIHIKFSLQKCAVNIGLQQKFNNLEFSYIIYIQ
jgi:hypothetical protein